MSEQQGDELWTFARFEPGHVFGTIEVVADDRRRADWERVFGTAGDRLPRGMLVAAMMEAYIRAIQPRPDGNIHAAQELGFSDAQAQWGDTVAVTVTLDGKEERKGRLWVRFGVQASVGGVAVMTGTIRSIWAA